ncbi:hypothetical protein Clacol_005643 [Clathrus columnatus]|uniref:P-loop containing nucleoside triphosphate hydrolase protein n=1 Tax=Clathrus columnatus TaxID=1419009 RepID=A0AAV5AHJ7_9AGAM|nr:hypothetical protein Clacol_005643 [Clathrus columnatus]
MHNPNDVESCRPVSHERDFDLTFCFEENALFPILFGCLLVVGGMQVVQMMFREALPKSTRSRQVLNIKLGFLFVATLGSFTLETFGTEFSTADGYEEIGKPENENPIISANIYSIWTFGWMTPLMKLGYKQYITESDMFALIPSDEAHVLGDKLHTAMKKHSALWVALFAAYGRPFAFAAFLKLIQDSLSFLQPQLLRLLLTYITDYQRARDEGVKGPSPFGGFALAALMFIAALTQSVILHQYFQRVYETGMRIRAGLVTNVYRKALVLSSQERGERASGDIVNLMSVDTVKLQDFCTYGLILISGPYQIALAFISLYNLLGWPAFVGVAVMVGSLPITTTIAKILKRLQRQQMKNRDQRTRMMTELLANIKSIKLYGWEPAFIRRIFQIRNDRELRMLRSIGLVSFPNMTTSFIEAMVSIKRLSDFLRAGELQADARKVIHKETEEGDEVLKIEDGEFQWNRTQVESTLSGIDLTIRKGELIGIMGRVGSGKSSLLSAIIGEMYRTEGNMAVSASIAYCPQNPWIMSATVRDNILFSHTYDPEFYEEVIDACALRQDLALLAEGDMTQLSGGQRARISLARAVYARADLYLLDDVLAAVDSHVARHVFDHVIGPSGILASKARVLVTNTVSFLAQHDRILFLRRGIILENCSFNEIIADEDKQLHKLISGNSRVLSSRSGTSTPRGDDETLAGTPPNESIPESLFTVQSALSKLPRRDYGKPALVEVGRRLVPKSDGIVKEHAERGRVKPVVYAAYMKAASIPGFMFFIICVIAQQTFQVLSSYTLQRWGQHNQETGDNSNLKFYIMLYGLFALAAMISSSLGSVTIFVFLALRSARHLHDNMLFAVMRAPLSFFEQTPAGRTLNLFSRDTYVVDQVLANIIANMFRTLSAIGGMVMNKISFSGVLIIDSGILVVVTSSFPLFVIAFPFLGYFYYKIMVYYLATSRELKRLDATSRSPIFSSFSETLNGVSTIRAFAQQTVFAHENQLRIDRNQMCYLPSISVNRWLAIRLELVGNLLIFIASTLACVALLTTGVDASLVGLMISYGLNTTGALNWFVRSASEVEQNIVSVERVLYQTNVESEAPEHIPDMLPASSWPSEGKIEFISLKRKSVYAGGLLLLALFRIIEPASGTILIDGVDITTIGLNDLRSVISIIPQESQMFEGTMRENIDPIGNSDDAAIWVALEQARLKEYIESLPSGLDTQVQEGGTSLSAGQRQLVCFARALLRKVRPSRIPITEDIDSKVLVLDEATSAIDLETDKAVQEILRGPQFKDTTILTIAHRLNTIIESDRVLVLDQGTVAEFDTPQALINAPGSIFASLAREAGVGLSEPLE